MRVSQRTCYSRILTPDLRQNRDRSMIVRDKPRFWDILFALRGSIVPRIAPHMAVMGVVSVLAVLLVRWRPEVFAQLGAMPFTLIGIALSIFMSFRNNAAMIAGGRLVSSGASSSSQRARLLARRWISMWFGVDRFSSAARPGRGQPDRGLGRSGHRSCWTEPDRCGSARDRTPMRPTDLNRHDQRHPVFSARATSECSECGSSGLRADQGNTAALRLHSPAAPDCVSLLRPAAIRVGRGARLVDASACDHHLLYVLRSGCPWRRT
jgi:hypothetical protein